MVQIERYILYSIIYKVYNIIIKKGGIIVNIEWNISNIILEQNDLMILMEYASFNPADIKV